MLVVQVKLDAAVPHDAVLVLPFELRQKSRLRTTVAGGEEIGLFLERGTVLRDGECLGADDGRVVRVAAADENLIEVRCKDADALARAAYHLGNRHTPVQVGAGWLRLAADDVLAGMLRGLGAAVTPVRAPFEPEAGAYAAGHHAHSATRSTPASSTISPRAIAMPADPLLVAGIAVPAAGAPSLLPLVRLLQLASPTLPIGAYSYSQGLEWAVESGEVRDAASAHAWIGDVLECVVAPGEAAVAWRLLAAAERADWPAARDVECLVPRLARDRRAAGGNRADGRLARQASAGPRPHGCVRHGSSLPRWRRSRCRRRMRSRRALSPCRSTRRCAYVWSWLENQVLAAIKLVPLGQVAGQRLLVALGARIPQVVAIAMTIDDADLSTFAPGLCLASARHETQYTRLFRS